MWRPFVILVAILAGCGLGAPTGPATTHTTSAQFATLPEKAAFLHQYVSFRRTYETLDFDINFRNGVDGGVPSPSEWDIRLVVKVPASELDAWVPQDVPRIKARPADLQWLESVPGPVDVSGMDEWYDDPRYHNRRRTVGLDRQRRLVMYRNLAY